MRVSVAWGSGLCIAVCALGCGEESNASGTSGGRAGVGGVGPDGSGGNAGTAAAATGGAGATDGGGGTGLVGVECGELGQPCLNNDQCGNGLTCLITGEGICQPAGRTLQGGFQCVGGDCPAEHPICLKYQDTFGGVCVTGLERDCMCSTTNGQQTIVDCPGSITPTEPCNPQRLGELPGPGHSVASVANAALGQNTTPVSELRRSIAAVAGSNADGLAVATNGYVTKDSLTSDYISFIVAVDNISSTTRCRLSPSVTIRDGADTRTVRSAQGELLGSSGVLADKLHTRDCLYPGDSGFVVYIHDTYFDTSDEFAEAGLIRIHFSQFSEPGQTPAARMTAQSVRVTGGRYEVTFQNDGLIPGRTYAGYSRFVLFDASGTPVTYGGLAGDDGNHQGLYAPGQGGTLIQRQFQDRLYTGEAVTMRVYLSTQDANLACGP